MRTTQPTIYAIRFNGVELPREHLAPGRSQPEPLGAERRGSRHLRRKPRTRAARELQKRLRPEPAAPARARTTSRP